ncbi:MAG: helix-turn-helix transcriptional regulator [Subdoligranulum sp.]|nr:helix-turn-helix transcriptional regulator [Subdoligranulum sp.]
MLPAKALGKNIRYLRKVKGLTQEELACNVGISTMSIRRYESGDRIATEEIIKRIAKALDVDELTLLPKSNIVEMDINELGIKAEYVGGFGETRYIVDEAKQRLNEMFDMLNTAGQKEALKRVDELCEVPRYQRTDQNKQGLDEKTLKQHSEVLNKTTKQRFEEFRDRTEYQEDQ